MGEKKASVYAKLADIQSKLFVPKGKENKFGGFNYRSCEDILKTVKPLVCEAKCALFLSNRMIAVNDRDYVEVTATLYDCESAESISVTAQAREPGEKKGMDVMQVTGATSSYARKYALAGLFCIDNEKDADDMDNRDEGRAHGNAPAKKAEPVKPSLGKEAWDKFRALNPEMESEELKLSFSNTIRTALKMKEGETISSKNITDAQWKEIIKAIDAAAEIANVA